MLKHLHVDNYKCLVNFDLDLQPLNLLLGANGSGKSAIFDVMYAVRQLLSGVARVGDRDIFPTTTLTRWQTLPKQTFECTVELAGDEFTYTLEVEHELATQRNRVTLERLSSSNKPIFSFINSEVTLYRDDFSKGAQFTSDWSESALARVAPRRDNQRLTRFLDFMRKILVCGLYPRSFLAEAATEDPLLLRDGSNFTAWYRHIFQERQDLIPDYLDDIRNVIDGLSGIRLEKVGQETRAFMIAFVRERVRYELRLDELSDGQRALIALYALVRITQGQGYTLFLDEPDNYVALAEMQPWLMAIKDTTADGLVPQVVFSSHHPEFIDYLGAEAGVWLHRDHGGPTRVKPLQASPESPLKLSEVISRGWLYTQPHHAPAAE